MRLLRPPPARPARLAAALAAAGALAAAAGARADGLTLRLEPNWAGTTTFTTDETGRSARVDQGTFQQRYRLNVDRLLYPNLRFGAGGLYDWNLGTTTTPLARSEVDQRAWSGFARLALTSELLNGSAAYDRREDSTDVRIAAVPSSTPTLVRESYSLAGTWNPEGLALVEVRAGRAHTFDRSLAVTDVTRDEASLRVFKRLESRLELEYVGRWDHPQNALTGSDTQELTQTGRAAYGRTFLGDRGSMFASYALQHHVARTTATGLDGEVEEQRFPSGGLSIVEPLPPLPERVTLNPNPQLVDGDLAGTSGVDVGFAASLSGDTRPRDVGVSFANAQTQVNELRVWVDVPLPRGVWDRLAWTAWKSDDNVTWTPVPLARAVDFDPFLNRYAIRIQPTRARHLKVVTAPLLAAVTTDARFASIHVTEVQAYELLPAAQVRGTTSFATGTFNGSGRYLLQRSLGLAYDVAVLAAHDPAGGSFTVVNGISLARRLDRMTIVSARADRSDTSDATGHVGQFRLTSSLGLDPLPTVGAVFTYSGQATQRDAGWTLLNAVTLVTRLEPHEGVSLSSNATLSLQNPDAGGRTLGRIAGASVSLTPHPKVALTGTYAYTLTDVEGPGVSTRSEGQRLEATVSVTPIPALFGTASVARTILDDRPATLANFAVNVSPFPGGDLLLRAQYNETLDTGTQQKTRLMGPSLRWNVRRGAYFDVNYTYTETLSPVLDTSTRALFASFVATLG